MRSGQELALLVGIAVHGVVDEVRANTAVIQKRIAFARRPISDYRFSLSPDTDQEFKKLPLGLLHLLSEIAVCLDSAIPGVIFPLPHFDGAITYGLGAVLVVPAVDSKRSAVR